MSSPNAARAAPACAGGDPRKSISFGGLIDLTLSKIFAAIQAIAAFLAAIDPPVLAIVAALAIGATI